MRLWWFALVAGICQAAPPLVIQDVAVIDVRSAAVRQHMTVVIEGEKIKAIGSAVQPPVGARMIAGSGKFLIPGLWDMHVHLGYLEGQLPTFVAYGVTGVQDMGSDFRKTSGWRAAIESGKAIGPHIVTSGPPVNGVASDDE